jgi:hypothetical protein
MQINAPIITAIATGVEPIVQPPDDGELISANPIGIRIAIIINASMKKITALAPILEHDLIQNLVQFDQCDWGLGAIIFIEYGSILWEFL